MITSLQRALQRQRPTAAMLALLLLPFAREEAATAEQRAPAQPRSGIVRLDGRGFVDDDGAYLAVGTTLFWAAWGYAHDRERLEKNLAFLSGQGIDYIRVLGVVGDADNPRDAWRDRAIGPLTPDYDTIIAGLTDLAYDKYGLRTEWTLFGGLPPEVAARRDREAVARRFVQMSRGREHKIQYWEVANEAWQNGFGGRDGIAELRELGRILRESTPLAVALTSPTDRAYQDALYGGSAANLLTMHLDRDVHGPAGAWDAVRRSWQVQFDWSGGWTSDEPIGPGSSVATDSDPVRIAMSAAVTWLSGGAAYVLHTGAGIYGRSGTHDVGGFRPANVWEQPGIERILGALRAVRSLLPADLPEWKRHNSNANFPEYPFELGPLAPLIEGSQLVRAYAATSGNRVVALPLGMKTSVPLVPKRAMHLRAHDPVTAEVRREADVAAGATFAVPAADAAIVIGEMQ